MNDYKEYRFEATNWTGERIYKLNHIIGYRGLRYIENEYNFVSALMEETFRAGMEEWLLRPLATVTVTAAREDEIIRCRWYFPYYREWLHKDVDVKYAEHRSPVVPEAIYKRVEYDDKTGDRYVSYESPLYAKRGWNIDFGGEPNFEIPFWIDDPELKFGSPPTWITEF